MTDQLQAWAAEFGIAPETVEYFVYGHPIKNQHRILTHEVARWKKKGRLEAINADCIAYGFIHHPRPDYLASCRRAMAAPNMTDPVVTVTVYHDRTEIRLTGDRHQAISELEAAIRSLRYGNHVNRIDMIEPE